MGNRPRLSKPPHIGIIEQVVMRRWRVVMTGLAVGAAALALDLERPFSGDLDHPAIQYATRPEQNAVSELNARLRDGSVRLSFDGTPGYLRSVLAALRIPIESQLVVFSKTSLQQRIISASNPRSLFFNDSVAVGWVPGEPFVEVAAQDAAQGVIFYTLDQRPSDRPVFVRRDQPCLQCHEDYATVGVPGLLARSVFPAPDGTAVRPFGEFVTDGRSPFAQRWGGWFATGTSGGLPHLGNRTFSKEEDTENIPKRADLSTLAGKFDTTRYLSPYSDIVALLVFNHQVRMINLITRLGWEARVAAYDGHPAALQDAIREFVDYLLFVDEAPLASGIRGSSGFAEQFSGHGPVDHKGRSLRQLDLQRRLLRYPCSYLIYSPAFDALPATAKQGIYRRMWEVLSGEEKGPKYARLAAADRQAVIEILRDTKAGLPDYFRATP